MNKKVLVVMADGFEEIEAVTIIDILRRAEIEVVSAGLGGTTITGSHGIKVISDALLDQVKDKSFDALILPGGGAGVANLRKDKRVVQLVQRFHDQKALVGAICAAPAVLSDAGIIKQKKVTSYPGFEKQIQCAHYSTEAVVVDGNVITSRAPGTALRFALKLVEHLLGQEKSRELAEMTLAG